MANDDLGSVLRQLSALDNHEKPKDTYRRAPFAWPGGKSRSLPYLLPLLPVRKSYIETCGGSGVVLLNRPRSGLEVFNDRFSGVTAFYRCIREKGLQEALGDRLSTVLHSKEEFVWSVDTWANCDDLVERAARWFYTVKTSFGSIGEHWGRSTTCISMLAPKLRESVSEFPAIHYRFRDVQIENDDIIPIIREYSNDDSVVYIDPDYLETSRHHYDHQMDELKHLEILHAVHDGKGFYAVSGYANKMYDDPSWHWTDRRTWKSLVTADAGTREYKEEVLWVKDHTE